MNSKRNITYKCPYCDKRFNKEDLVTHVSDDHDDMIPEGYSSFRLVFDYVNKKPAGYNGKCIICGKESGWDENKGKYNRLCGNPSCKQKYVQSFEERMMKTKGVTRISSTAEGQAKMLANRKISGEYKFQDGGIKTYTGTYEKKALEFMDKVMNIKSIDITTPGPIMEYDYKDEKHIYISDIYYAPYNLIIEVKDGGNNPNNRSMPDYRAKQIAKERYIIKNTDYNYLRLTNNDFSQLLSVFMQLKMEMSNDTPERVVRINEGVISDRLKYSYKYGQAKKINEELANKINSTDYPWYFINLTELKGTLSSTIDINLYGLDEEPVNGIDKSKPHHLYNKKAKGFHGTDSLNPSLRKYTKYNKGAAKTKDVVLKEDYIEELFNDNKINKKEIYNNANIIRDIVEKFIKDKGYNNYISVIHENKLWTLTDSKYKNIYLINLIRFKKDKWLKNKASGNDSIYRSTTTHKEADKYFDSIKDEVLKLIKNISEFKIFENKLVFSTASESNHKYYSSEYNLAIKRSNVINEKSEDIREAMNALMTGYIPGSVDNPNNVYIVNYMQNNVFSDEDPNEDCIGVSDNIKLTNLVVRNNDSILKRVDESFLKDKDYKVYILEMSRDEVSSRLSEYMNTKVDKNFIYETLTGHKLYTNDQINFESSFTPVTDYYEFIETFREICNNYFSANDKREIPVNESTFIPKEIRYFNKSGLMYSEKIHNLDEYINSKPNKVLECLDVIINN